jgi:hypothetical protein
MSQSKAIMINPSDPHSVKQAVQHVAGYMAIVRDEMFDLFWGDDSDAEQKLLTFLEDRLEFAQQKAWNGDPACLSALCGSLVSFLVDTTRALKHEDHEPGAIQ